MTGSAKRSESRGGEGGQKRTEKRAEKVAAPPVEGDLDAVLEDLYGRVDWQAAGGVLHVTAIAAADRATIALGPDAPSSAFDRFVLGFARARADALVTTGSILRAEPALQHRYADDAARDADWRAWRANTLGMNAKPGLILLSRSGDFPHDHPAIEAAESGFVWTSKATRARIGPCLGALEVIAAEEVASEQAGENGGVESANAGTGLAAALSFAGSRRGLSRIAIEAGPSATQGLYPSDSSASPARVDEVLLSLYRGDLLPSARAAAFASEDQLRATGLRRASRCEKQELSGVWCFERYRLARVA